ncbi:MAG: TOBE-like domain-containing protein [Neisseria sp.]
MKSSARNQLNGVITQIVPAGGLCFLSVLCGGETCIEAQISQSSLTRLKLAIGSTVVVMIKAPSVMLVTDLSPLELSAENCLPGVVKQVEQGVVNNVVTLALDTGAILTATVTLYSSETLALSPGQPVTAVFNANQVVIGVLV